MVLARRSLLLLALGAATLAAVLAFALTRADAPAQAAAKTVRIDIKDFAYSKTKVTVARGTTITWTNRDDMEHDVTRDGSKGPKSKLLGKGKSYSWKASKAGTFKYHCSPHAFMKGTIVVK